MNSAIANVLTQGYESIARIERFVEEHGHEDRSLADDLTVQAHDLKQGLIKIEEAAFNGPEPQ